MYLIPFGSYDEISKHITELRQKDHPNASMSDLQHKTKAYVEELRSDLASYVPADAVRSTLKMNTRYGTIEYAPRATAFRNGRMIPNHGEIYTVVWHFDRNDPEILYCANAWGSRTTKRITPDLLLIELDHPASRKEAADAE